MLRGRSLTWDQLQSRGFLGPSRCVLCEDNLEDIHHLFFCCPFSASIFNYFAIKFNCSFLVFNTVHSFLDQWFSSTARSAPFRFLPLFIFWGTWLLRNHCLFENRKPSFSALISRIDGLINTHPVPIISHKPRSPGPAPLKSFPCGYFDGAAAENVGGAGFVIYINDTHFFSFSMGCGSSTNTRVKL